MTKVLLISHNALCGFTNNGQTLFNILSQFSPDEIANLYITASLPDKQYASSYFRITDYDVAHHGLSSSLGAEVFASPAKEHSSSEGRYKKKKTSFKLLVREIMWSHCRWNGKRFKAWLDKVNPTVILLQAGSTACLANIARKISKQRKIPILVYNTENYLFRDYDWTNPNKRKPGLAFRLFKRKLVNGYKKLPNTCWVHLTDEIANKHAEMFPESKHIVLRNSYSWAPISHYSRKPGRFNVCYFGNMNFRRDEALADVAKALFEISPDYRLILYGVPENAMASFDGLSNVVFKKFASMEQIHRDLENDVDCVCLAESFDKSFFKILVDIFSTKIPNCLNSGLPFLVYSPVEYCFINYLSPKNSAAIAASKDALKDTILRLINDEEYASSLVKKALELAQENHDPIKNGKRMKELILEVEGAK